MAYPETKVKKLIDGSIVCSSCPDYLLECEARSLLDKTLASRRLMLAAAEAKRGDISALKAKMVELFDARKK